MVQLIFLSLSAVFAKSNEELPAVSPGRTDGPFLMVIGRNKNHFPFPRPLPQTARSPPLSVSSLPPCLPPQQVHSLLAREEIDTWQDVETVTASLSRSERLCRCVACIIRRFLSVCPQSVSQTFVRCRLVSMTLVSPRSRSVKLLGTRSHSSLTSAWN